MDRHDTLLLVCDSGENRETLRSVLEERFNLLEATNPHQAWLLLEQNRTCIASVLVDVSDPASANRTLLTEKRASALMEQLPIIAICSEDAHEMLNWAFRCGAADVIPVNYDGYAMLKRIQNIVRLSLHERNLEELVSEQAELLRHSNDAMVDALSSIIEYRSVESGQHILRIRHFTRILLKEVVRWCPEYAMTEEVIDIISSASALHDIGKIAIPDAILTKPGKLTQEEREVMKTHTLTGCQILDSLSQVGDREYLRYAHNICHYHHERWDGNGYPEGLSGNNIPICAQVVGLADVYDALTSKRVYKEAYSFEKAVNMILNGECGVFSPKLLECFKRVTDEYENLARAYADGLSPKTETFDVTLREPEGYEADSMELIRAKYYALVHYSNALLMELNLDENTFHLIYNPYPELIRFGELSSYEDIVHLVLSTIVVPEEQERMQQFLHRDIDTFIREGMRRVNYLFRFRSPGTPEGESFEVTLLRLNPMNSNRRTLAVLCRKAENRGLPAPVNLVTDSDFTCRNDDHFTLLQLSPHVPLLAGYTREELKENFGNRLTELVLPEDREKMRAAFREQLSHGVDVSTEFRVRRKDGRVLWVLDKSRLSVDENGQEFLHSFMIDISQSRKAYDWMEERLHKYEIILAQTENVLFEWDLVTGAIDFSDTWEKIFGYRVKTGDKNITQQLKAFFHPDDMPLIQNRVAAMQEGSSYEMLEVRITTARGQYLWCRIRATAIRNEAGRLARISGIIINIDAEKQAELALQDRAERDALTKLLNKHAGRKHAEEYFAQYPQGANCALLIIDLDNFKQVNDQYGHLFGDSVLTSAAKEIKNLFRTKDIVARIGGDEFMVLMRGVSSRSLVESRCTRLIATFLGAIREQHADLPLGCSVGIAMAPEHGTSYYELFQHADQALYQAKAQGKGGYMFYNSKDVAFLSSQTRTTAVNNRIDSDDEPGLADNSIVQYAFQRLYSSANVDAAIQDILDLIGRQMNVSRVYIFEDAPDHRSCSNTYEWCNAGTIPTIDSMQNVRYDSQLPGFADNFDEDGIFCCPDVDTLPIPTYEMVSRQGVKSMLLCAIRDKGVFSGFIGFDECVTQRVWTKEKIELLRYFSEMLSVFLLKKRAQDRTNQRLDALSSILDNQNAWIYIVDLETCQLKYRNAKAKASPFGTEMDKFCLGDPLVSCENCMIRSVLRKKNTEVVVRAHRTERPMVAESTLIQWEGKPACLVTCRELPEEETKS